MLNFIKLSIILILIESITCNCITKPPDFLTESHFDVTEKFEKKLKIKSPKDGNFYTLTKVKNFTISTDDKFPNGLFYDHIFETTFRLSVSYEKSDWNLINVIGSKSNDQIYLRLNPIKKSLKFFGYFSGDTTTVVIPNLTIFDGKWHNIKYSLEKGKLQIWIDCKHVKNSEGNLENHLNLTKTIYEYLRSSENYEVKIAEPFKSTSIVTVDVLRMKFHFNPTGIIQAKKWNSEETKSREILGESFEIDNGNEKSKEKEKTGKILENYSEEMEKLLNAEEIERLLNEVQISSSFNSFPDVKIIDPVLVGPPGLPGLRGPPGLPGKCSCLENCKQTCNKPLDRNEIKDIMKGVILDDMQLRGPPGKPGMDGLPGNPGLSGGTIMDMDAIKTAVIEELSGFISQYINVQMNKWKYQKESEDMVGERFKRETDKSGCSCPMGYPGPRGEKGATIFGPPGMPGLPGLPGLKGEPGICGCNK